MLLSQLLSEVDLLGIQGPIVRDVIGITLFPEEVGIDWCFVSLPHPDRITAGIDGEADRRLAGQKAAVIITQMCCPGDISDSLTWVQVKNIVIATELVFANFYRHPSRDVRVFGITGTNGKTTTAYCLSQILEKQGRNVGTISTISCRFSNFNEPMPYTTLAPGRLHSLLYMMREAGCTDCVMEATSHTMTFNRHIATNFAVGGFLNFSRDHLDFHQTMDNYLAAKLSLFDCCDSACFNIDCPESEIISRSYLRPHCTISLINPNATLYAHGISMHLEGYTDAIIVAFGKSWNVRIPLLGQHNVYNVLMALGMAYLGGADIQICIHEFQYLRAPAGRLQRVLGKRHIFIDYAHTPDGLESVLLALRPLVKGQLICLFGAGGDRDQGKRPLMGKVASYLADYLVVTSDNPRSEDPLQIAKDIIAGIIGNCQYRIVLDRAQAIQLAIALLGPEDCLLIAGKGHENIQIFSDKVEHFSDIIVAEKYLENCEIGV